MSNNNRRQSQNNYQQQRQQPYTPRPRQQGQQHPQHPPPYYQNNPHYPPYYPPPYFPPPYKDDQMRPAYGQQQMPNPYFYQHYPHYPMPFPNYQQPFPYPSPQQPPNEQKGTPQKRNYEKSDTRNDKNKDQDRGFEQQEKNYQQKPDRNFEQRQDRPYEQKQDRPYEQRQDRIYEQKRKTYDNKTDRNYDSRNERKFEPRENRTFSPRQERASNNQMQQIRKRNESQDSYDEENDSSSFSESEQVIYRRKAIAKKKDPVLDSKEEIRKWIQARKRNYPKQNLKPQQHQGKVQQSEISILQKKIRKKILLINSDPRSMMKKLKDIDILRRFILYSRKPRRNAPIPIRRYDKHEHDGTARAKFVEPIGSMEQIEAIEPQEAIEPPEVIETIEPIQTEPKIHEQPQVELANKSEIIIPEQEQAVEQPIKNRPQPQRIQVRERQYGRREELSVDVIIKHLQMKQSEDIKTLENLMDYKSNSFHYRYQHQTLQTNLLLDNIFNETSYILQAIRYIVKNNFFDKATSTQTQ